MHSVLGLRGRPREPGDISHATCPSGLFTPSAAPACTPSPVPQNSTQSTYFNTSSTHSDPPHAPICRIRLHSFTNAPKQHSHPLTSTSSTHSTPPHAPICRSRLHSFTAARATSAGGFARASRAITAATSSSSPSSSSNRSSRSLPCALLLLLPPAVALLLGPTVDGGWGLLAPPGPVCMCIFAGVGVFGRRGRLVGKVHCDIDTYMSAGRHSGGLGLCDACCAGVHAWVPLCALNACSEAPVEARLVTKTFSQTDSRKELMHDRWMERRCMNTGKNYPVQISQICASHKSQRA